MQMALIMGSVSDWPRAEEAWKLLREFGVETEVRVLSAHRTPAECAAFVREAEAAGVQVFIAAAGLAAHLPGVVAAHTRRPVIGLPLAAGPLQGRDALYSWCRCRRCGGDGGHRQRPQRRPAGGADPPARRASGGQAGRVAPNHPARVTGDAELRAKLVEGRA